MEELRGFDFVLGRRTAASPMVVPGVTQCDSRLWVGPFRHNWRKRWGRDTPCGNARFMMHAAPIEDVTRAIVNLCAEILRLESA